MKRLSRKDKYFNDDCFIRIEKSTREKMQQIIKKRNSQAKFTLIKNYDDLINQMLYIFKNPFQVVGDAIHSLHEGGKKNAVPNKSKTSHQ